MNDVGVQAFDDFASLEGGLGDRCPDGVRISGVEARGVAGMDMSSVSGLSSISLPTQMLVSGLRSECEEEEMIKE